MQRSGTVDLPLHGGRAPRWLFTRMVKLAKAVSDHIVYEHGSAELLRRVSDPYWFQAFSCVLGFDWHSSGTTTTTCGALKEAVIPAEHGIAVCGGKGAASRRTPSEIENLSTLFDIGCEESERLKYASRITAKVDNSCVQDSYQLYHHVFIFSSEGEWAVVQQGMSGRYARRYHWLSDDVDDFIVEPHRGICCDRIGKNVLDMTSEMSEESRRVSLDLVKDNPEHLKDYFRMPYRHPVLDVDLTEKDMVMLRKAYELQPQDYEELVSLRGMGPKKIRALALISELIHGAKPSWRDPVKFSFTHGGKDGFPYPVDRRAYDNSISFLRTALEEAKVEKPERMKAVRRLTEYIQST
ncbi:MAG: DUF763 domain-containing protein [Candidatus Altiarchaeota archaeon]